jgi:hypothetical protein
MLDCGYAGYSWKMLPLAAVPGLENKKKLAMSRLFSERFDVYVLEMCVARRKKSGFHHPGEAALGKR